mmetsp:Transcript_4038/g.6816  ORF Transcript_4038/g.6816 Transcript_4038/m.6816 type:complete len:511 (-) Transcript_4038:106-1638(-)
MASSASSADTRLTVPLLPQRDRTESMGSDDGSVTSGQKAGTPGLSEAMKREREAVAKLQDLTAVLQEHGLYDKFLAHREGNRRWRAGKESGAKGEPTARAITEQETKFVRLNPTVTTFTFRRMLAFWISVFYIEGCLLFLWSPLYARFGAGHEELRSSVTKGPTLVGGTFFGAGIYVSYLELINLNTDIDNARLRKMIFSWESLKRFNKAAGENDVTMWSVLGSLLYLFGASCFTLNQVCDFAELTPVQSLYLLEWPLTMGGFLFFLGGCCEIVINRTYELRPWELVWWVSLLNFQGGFCFWTSACPTICPDIVGVTVGEIGTVLYLIGAVLSLFMWQGEQFGGAIMPMLNRALREGGHLKVLQDPTTGVARIIEAQCNSDANLGESKQKDLSEVLNPRLSWRTILFLNFYLAMGAIHVVSCCMTIAEIYQELLWGSGNIKESVNDFISTFCNFMIVVMFLVLTSACVQMPHEEPFHTLVWTLRFLGIVLLINSVLTLQVQLEISYLNQF